MKLLLVEGVFSGTSKQQVSFNCLVRMRMRKHKNNHYFLIDGNGDWNTDGCNLTSFNQSTNVASCECDHLTNFACLVVSMDSPFV